MEKKSTSTISLNSNFVSLGLLDEIVECEATITKMTRSLIFVEGSIKSGEKTILSASGIWKILGQ